MQPRSRLRQQALWCQRCGAVSLWSCGLCRPCYDRQRHSRRYFSGHRDRVLARDVYCQLCWADQQLLVHHRRPGQDRPAWHVTLGVRCHVRLHRRLQLPGQYSAFSLELWQEQHPGQPVQLAFPLAA